MFPGFPSEALKFLRGLERNNRREWFQSRKEIFDTKVKAPMIDLVEAINAELPGFAPEHINDPKNAVYRIYRDTRFSPDKTPYKTHIAAIFPRRGVGQAELGGILHSSFAEVFRNRGAAPTCPDRRSCGQFAPGSRRIMRPSARPREGRKSSWGKLHGDSLTRSPKGFDPDHPAADLIRMKSWLYWIELDSGLAETPKLFTEVMKRFRAAAPVVDMLNAPLITSRRKAVAG